MNLPEIDPKWRMERLESGRLPGERWREIGCNARKGVHGKHVPLDLVRITIAGETGMGWSGISKKQAEVLLSTCVKDMFAVDGRIRPEYRELEYPLLDWLGRICNKPVHALNRHRHTLSNGHPLLVPCYDTTFYFDDLHLDDDLAAIHFMQAKAREAWDFGHRAFKIKVGRGSRHMPLQSGIGRDIAIIRGIREAVGSQAHIMIDANNSYNLNITKEVLYATADARLTFIEEPFYEDPVLYEDLKSWMSKEKLSVMIADGEGLIAAPSIIEWAKQGLIDVIQFDIRFYGYTRLLELEDALRGSNVKQAPHNYGGPFGNYATCHLAPALERFLFIEWDEVTVPALDSSAYVITDGKVRLPQAPGFGLQLDDCRFNKAVQENGWSIP